MHERMLDKTLPPSDADMLAVIGPPFDAAWSALRGFLGETYGITPTLDPGGKKYGWNLQHRLGGRPLCELYPEQGSFTALVILGRAELEQAMAGLDSFGALVRQALVETPRLHDGCWMYIRLADPHTCAQDEQDIERLILIKKKPPHKR
jgi:hypothetical protein